MRLIKPPAHETCRRIVDLTEFNFLQAIHRDMSGTQTIPHQITNNNKTNSLATMGSDLLELRGTSGERWLIKKRVMVIGRGPDADIRLEATERPAIARLVSRAGRLLIEDLEGDLVFVDGVPARRAPLELGSVIRIGSVLLVVARQESANPMPIEDQVAATGDSNVLIHGKPGGLQEITARMLHQSSDRRGPFLSIDCSAVPPAMLERELFGEPSDESPAFGAITLARGGTLYLHEVLDLPRATQDRLVDELRRQSHGASPVRVVASTTRDVDRAIIADGLSIDLHAMLARSELSLRGLADRREEIAQVAQTVAQRQSNEAVVLSTDALEAMMLHDWPLNEQELESVMAGVLHADATRVELEHLRPEFNRLHERRRAQGRRRRRRADQDGDPRERVLEALRVHKGNVRRASKEAGYSRGHFYRLLDQFKIDPATFRRASGAAATHAIS